MPKPSSRRGAAAEGVVADFLRSALMASGLLLPALAGCAVNREVTAVPPVPTAPPKPVLMQLVGIDAEALQRQFGKPGLIWREEPAQVWQYRGPACVLNVYLYRDNDRLVVSDAEAHSKENKDDPLPPCVASLLDARKVKTPS
jgi:hypothetical protein